MNTMKRPFVTGILLASVLFPPASAQTTKPAGKGKAQLVAEFARLIQMDAIVRVSASRLEAAKVAGEQVESPVEFDDELLASAWANAAPAEKLTRGDQWSKASERERKLIVAHHERHRFYDQRVREIVSPDRLKKVAAREIDQTFTGAELRQLVDFCRTGLGKKTVAFLSGDLEGAIEEWASEEIDNARLEALRRSVPGFVAMTTTLADIRSIGTSVEAYAVDHNQYPVAADIRALTNVLTPTYMAKLPHNDGWGTEFQYIATQHQYRIVSAGPDRRFSTSSRDFAVPEKPTKTTVLDDDIIFQLGNFLRYPEGMLVEDDK